VDLAATEFDRDLALARVFSNGGDQAVRPCEEDGQEDSVSSMPGLTVPNCENALRPSS
jgi:hypothetical protein